MPTPTSSVSNSSSAIASVVTSIPSELRRDRRPQTRREGRTASPWPFVGDFERRQGDETHDLKTRREDQSNFLHYRTMA